MRFPLVGALALTALLLPACGGADDEVPSTGVTTSGSVGGGGGFGGSGAEGGAGGMTTDGSGGGLDWTPVDTAWCSDGWTGLDAETCFYAPENGSGSSVLIYLHGMMPPDASPAGQQALVAQAADALGMVALFPKGRPGLCSWDVSVEDWLCWPTANATVAQHAGSITEPWTSQVPLLESITGHNLSTRYLLGFSNGGYFVSFLALQDLWPHDGAALAGAGRTYIDPSVFGQSRPPIFIAVGADESAQVVGSAQNLAKVLTQHSWPHELAIDAQRGHELRPADFTRAHALWTAP